MIRKLSGEPNITLHMVASLDGFVARKDDDIAWMESSWCDYDRGASLEDGAAILESIDCYIMGSKTYELALKLGWPYGTTPVIVMTNRKFPPAPRSVEFFGEGPGELARAVKARYNQIWLVGGPTLAQEFLRLDLVDAICMTVIPILLGDGVPFFGAPGTEKRLRLTDTIAFRNGMVDLHYAL